MPALLFMISVCIPAYLESANLAVLLPRIRDALALLGQNSEILIIDTQQPMDNTSEICAANGACHIHRQGGNSYGDAIRTMIANAQGDYLLCMDADGSHSPSYFGSMWAERDRYDIVIGSRYVSGGQTENPRILIFLSWVVNVTFRMVFSLKAKDVTNSFRLYHRDVLTKLVLRSDDFDILQEILIKALIEDRGLRLGEVPVTFGRRHSGDSKRKLLHFALGYLKTLQRLRSFAKAAKREKAGR